MRIHELVSLGGLRAACGDDDLVMWNAQDLGLPRLPPGFPPRPGPARAWAAGGAVVAAAPMVSRRDRLAVWGEAADAADLVRHALAELGPSYRPWGERELMAQLTAKVDGLEVAGAFSWMTLPTGTDPLAALPGPARARDMSARDMSAGEVDAGPARAGGVAAGEVGWLRAADAGEVAALLAADAPDSYARPADPGVRRWAGLRVDGVLASVAADAWPSPSAGLLAGVATRAAFRGRGLAERVCRWVSAELVASYGRAALMVDDDNAAAIAVYRRIGYRLRPVLVSSANP
ncbi:GNAT family N-acetyltransferase [Nonomuraea sp. MCN248]|uniref:GNAT family N-acetyltransferase n=1 Tax=Nonomuraea corallina TaxID=2989783 RepID=A0ABT4SGR9_9ACTN|nr:GNAT family N-acetyltransferase [Nonomuraea corallina]MDA0636406.1 GNAT family N-acetyltransferase [Nonomuraea corallina]